MADNYRVGSRELAEVYFESGMAEFMRELATNWLSANQVGVRVSSSAQLGLPA